MQQQMPWLKFLPLVLPDLYRLARDLYQAFRGDPEAARAELRRITDYKASYERNRAKNAAALDALPDVPARDKE